VLRRNHNDAVSAFRRTTFDEKALASRSVTEASTEFARKIEEVKREGGRQIETLKEALEVVKREGREEVEREREEVRNRGEREGREQVRALTMAHEAEVSEVLRHDKVDIKQRHN